LEYFLRFYEHQADQFTGKRNTVILLMGDMTVFELDQRRFLSDFHYIQMWH